jgi:optic atrophy 3 protein
MYRYEVRLRTGLLGEPPKHIRPLSETRCALWFLAPGRETPTDRPALRAIESGANFLAEGFLFSVAAALIVSETWRSSRSQSKQRSDVKDSIEELRTRVHELGERLRTREEVAAEERQQYVTSHTFMTSTEQPRRYEQLVSILGRVIETGLRGGGWTDLQDDSPLQLPRVQSNLLQSMSPSYSTDAVLSSDDTRNIS